MTSLIHNNNLSLVDLNIEVIKANHTPPNSLMDLVVSPKKKTVEGKGLGARSMAHSTLGYKGVLELWDGTKKIDKQVFYSHGFAQTKQWLVSA
jgi:hypothetical protein